MYTVVLKIALNTDMKHGRITKESWTVLSLGENQTITMKKHGLLIQTEQMIKNE